MSRPFQAVRRWFVKKRPRLQAVLIVLGIVWLLLVPAAVLGGQIQHSQDLSTLAQKQTELNQRDKAIGVADKELAAFAVWVIGSLMTNHDIACEAWASAPATKTLPCPALPPLPVLKGVNQQSGGKP